MTPTWLDRAVWLVIGVLALSLAANAAEAVMRGHTLTLRPVEECRLVRVDPSALSANPLRGGE
jgi:hypothetical protein